MEKSIFEQMGGTYRREGDYLIPNISVPDTKEYNIGKYGNLHRQFLEKNYPVYYSIMLSLGVSIVCAVIFREINFQNLF